MVDHRRMEEIQKFQMKDISDTCGKCMYVVKSRERSMNSTAFPGILWDYMI